MTFNLMRGPGSITVVLCDGTDRHIAGLRMGAASSRAVFGRTGAVDLIRVHLPAG